MPVPNPVRNYAEEESNETAKDHQGYFVIWSTEDGDVLCEFMSRERLLHRLEISYWGDREVAKLAKGEIIDLRSKSVIYICKGEIITPMVKEVVMYWDVP